MEYTIELTENQKKQMDFMLDMANKHMGFNRKIEIFEDGKKKATTNAEGEKIIYSEEEMQSVIDATSSVEYNRGLEDLSHAMKVYFPLNSEERLKHFGTNIHTERYAIENPKDLIAMAKAYEEKKKAEEEIKVGDIVMHKHDMTLGVVYRVEDGLAYGINSYLNSFEWAMNLCTKEGHIGEMETLLKKLRGEKND